MKMLMVMHCKEMNVSLKTSAPVITSTINRLKKTECRYAPIVSLATQKVTCVMQYMIPLM